MSTCKECGKEGEVGGWGLCSECFDIMYQPFQDAIQEIAEREGFDGKEPTP